jgi:hypothetical protein
MVDLKIAIPLSFALALSAAGPSAAKAAVSDPSELLKPGSLRDLARPGDPARPAETIIDQARGRRGVRTQLAQCWQGYWRRC